MSITFRIMCFVDRKSLKKRGFLEQGQAQDLQDFAEGPVEAQFAFHDRDQEVDADRDPNCVFTAFGLVP